MSQGAWRVLLNPVAGAGRAGRLWPQWRDALASAGIELEEVWVSPGPGAGVAWARAQVAQGARRLLAVGGDGTLNELATGALGPLAEGPDDLALALWPGGTGQDMAKRLGCPSDARALARALAQGSVARLDLATLKPTDLAQAPWAPRLVLNAASAGISGKVLQALDGVPRVLPGQLRYALAAIQALFGGEAMDAWAPQVVVDGVLQSSSRLVLSAVALGPTFGGGMRLAPSAQDQDGLLDWVGVAQATPLALLRLMPSLYVGGLQPQGQLVQHRQGRVVRWDEAACLEADGECLGAGGACVEVVPGALPMWRPRSSR